MSFLEPGRFDRVTYPPAMRRVERMAMRQLEGSVYYADGCDERTALVEAIERTFKITVKIECLLVRNGERTDWYTLHVPSKLYTRISDFRSGWVAGKHEGRLDMRGALHGETRAELAAKGIT